MLMPSRYIVKTYVEDGVYHIFNRGVEKRKIFIDDRDYKTFLYFLKIYLTKPEDLKNELTPQDFSALLLRQNFSDRIELLAYCLMPNHFHLLIRQKDPSDIAEFMRCLATNYSMYFNNRHDRVGSLFQGIYKAVLVKEDDYLLHLSRYIHLNPLELKGLKGSNPFNKLRDYDYSSFLDYLGKRNTKWLKPDLVLDFFKNEQGSLYKKFTDYERFVEGYALDPKEYLGKSTID